MHLPMEQRLLHVSVAGVHLFRLVLDQARKRLKVALGPDQFVEQPDRPNASILDRRIAPLLPFLGKHQVGAAPISVHVLK